MNQVGGIIWDITKCLCGRAKNEADYIYDFEENLESLKNKWKDLQSMKDDLKTIVDEAENTGGMQRAHEVDRWLKKVDDIEQEITVIEVQGAKEIQDKCLSKCCPKNCKSSYKLGKKATNMLKNVDQLVAEGRMFSGNFKIAHKIPPKPIEMPQDEVVGLDLMFDKVWKSIEDENVGIIGLYGMGGVGKTTLLKKINNELGKRRLGFDFVMWVVVSKEHNLDSIMDDIRELVGIGDDIWIKCIHPYQKAAKIYEVLEQKKFVLLLDDMWDSLNLKSVGVPEPKDPNSQSKVLFTTRLENVCEKMQAQKKFEVTILTEKEALELFCKKVGEETLSSHPNIPKLAEKMAKECKGLPLALIVVGSAMAGVKSLESWEHSINSLIESSWTAQDLEKKVFSILKFSYDNLDVVEKRCFLYCALYPEDYEIRVPDLIDKWMWEKFLCEDMTKSVQDMYGHGESVIERLKRSCLLESVDDDLFTLRTVKMHDVIRDMAVWLSKQDHDNLELLKRIFFRDDWESKKIVDDPPNVTIVSLNDTVPGRRQLQLEDIKCMTLKVLELHVRGEETLDMGGSISLEYLSLHMFMEILEPKFWINLGSLTNLKFLSFQNMRTEIPCEVIRSLQQLRVFRFIDSKIINSSESSFLKELESLPNIEELCVGVKKSDGLQKLLESTKLQSCIRWLSIDFCLWWKRSLSLGFMSGTKQLQRIVFRGLNIESDQYLFALETCCLAKLRNVRIHLCSITHVTWLKYAPLLQLLYIDRCESMEEMVKEEENVDSCVFSSLVNLTLQDLPRLEIIHKAPLSFPSLKSVRINRCPKLKKLPLDSNSAKYNKLTSIEGQQIWWDGLEWDDPAAKHKFQSKFECVGERIFFTRRGFSYN